jgi:hypothetical protein
MSPALLRSPPRPPSPPGRRRRALLALGLLALPVTLPAADDPALAWRDVSLGLVPAAAPVFTAASAEARYGEAITLLLRQPKTAGNLDRAVTLLTALAETSPATELGLAARYNLGRIAQVHRPTPDPELARQHYDTLIATAPAHPFAQQAFVKLALLDLYERQSDAARRAHHERPPRFDPLPPGRASSATTRRSITFRRRRQHIRKIPHPSAPRCA